MCNICMILTSSGKSSFVCMIITLSLSDIDVCGLITMSPSLILFWSLYFWEKLNLNTETRAKIANQISHGIIS